MKIVKKVLPFLMVGIVLSGCGSTNEDNEITMKKLIDANSYDVLLEQNNTVAAYTTYYNQDGEEDFTVYRAANIGTNGYVTTYEDSNGQQEFMAGDCVYLANSSANSLGILFFINQEEKDNYINLFKQANSWIQEDEKIISTVFGSGMAMTTTEIPVGEKTIDISEYFNLADYDSVHRIYTYDADTLKLEIYQEIAYSDEKSQLIKETRYTYFNDLINVPNYVEELQNPKETRIITLHDEDGKTEEYVVAKNATINFATPAGYGIYGDEEGTTPALETSKDLYILKIK